MKFSRTIVAGLAGAGLLFSPVVASAAPVAFDDLRASTQVDDGMAMGETAGANWLLILLGAAALIGAIIVIADDNPSSP